MISKQVFLSTKDNPFDYFTQFDEWFNYDRNVLGYNCVGILANQMKDVSESLPNKVYSTFAEQAIDSIIEKYPLIPFVKVSREIEAKYSMPEVGLVDSMEKI